MSENTIRFCYIWFVGFSLVVKCLKLSLHVIIPVMYLKMYLGLYFGVPNLGLSRLLLCWGNEMGWKRVLILNDACGIILCIHTCRCFMQIFAAWTLWISLCLRFLEYGIPTLWDCSSGVEWMILENRNTSGTPWRHCHHNCKRHNWVIRLQRC